MEDESTGAVEEFILKEEGDAPAEAVTLTVEEGVEGHDGMETLELSISEETAAAANGDLTPEMILSMMDR